MAQRRPKARLDLTGWLRPAEATRLREENERLRRCLAEQQAALQVFKADVILADAYLHSEQPDHPLPEAARLLCEVFVNDVAPVLRPEEPA